FGFAANREFDFTIQDGAPLGQVRMWRQNHVFLEIEEDDEPGVGTNGMAFHDIFGKRDVESRKFSYELGQMHDVSFEKETGDNHQQGLHLVLD
ncbi:MAG: hypothetical protein AAGA50_30870, partial [Pseudomonadota bacterium]